MMLHDLRPTLSATAVLLAGLIVLAGCQADFAGRVPSPEMGSEPARTEVLRFAGDDAAVSLDDPRWQQIPRMTLSLSTQELAQDKSLVEPGSVQIAYDSTALYLRVEMTDRDVVATATQESDRLFQTGDVAEWFVGSPPTADGQPGNYLELHVAPDGDRRAYRIDRPGLYQPVPQPPFTAEVRVDGTLNDFSDRDRGWAVLFVLPWSALAESTAAGGSAGDIRQLPLSLLLGRYNFGHHLPYSASGFGGPELSTWPMQPQTAFHLRPHHARIELVDAE